jgi:hypothetical protein
LPDKKQAQGSRDKAQGNRNQETGDRIQGREKALLVAGGQSMKRGTEGEEKGREGLVNL